jgi:hypothetical protein
MKGREFVAYGVELNTSSPPVESVVFSCRSSLVQLYTTVPILYQSYLCVFGNGMTPLYVRSAWY